MEVFNTRKPIYNKDKHRRGRRDDRPSPSTSQPSRAGSSGSRSRSESTVNNNQFAVNEEAHRSPLSAIEESMLSEGELSDESFAQLKSTDDETDYTDAEAEPDFNVGGMEQNGVNESGMSASIDINGNEIMTDINGNSGVSTNTDLPMTAGNSAIRNAACASDTEPFRFPDSETSLSRLGSCYSAQVFGKPKPDGYFPNSRSEELPLTEDELMESAEAEPYLDADLDPIEAFNATGDANHDDGFGDPDDDELEQADAGVIGVGAHDSDELFPIEDHDGFGPALESDSEAELEYILRSSAHDLQESREELQPTLSCTQLFNNSKPSVLENIVSRLDANDLLTARQVCKLWRKSITQADRFWEVLRVVKIKNLRATWEDFLKSDLVNEFGCPNYHFFRCDFLNEHGNFFILKTYQFMKHLTLTKCAFSLSTFQLILSECLLLEHLEIKCVPSCVSFSEAIYPVRHPTHGLKYLRTLILASTTKKCRGEIQPDRQHTGLTYVNLHKEFVSDLLFNTTALKKVKFAGFGSITCYHVINNLAFRNRRHSQLEELHFEDIPIENLNLDHFFPLAAISLNLCKFSLSLRNPIPQENRYFYDHKAFGNLIIHEIIKHNHSTLQELALDNIPLNGNVFIQPMPRITKISIVGTGLLLKGPELKSFMPKLEEVAEDYDPELRDAESEMFPNEISESETVEDYSDEEDIEVGFALSLTLGKFMMVLFAGICMYLLFRNFVSGISTETLASMIFVYVVISMIALCTQHGPA